jgi:group I intron endonuclease
MDIKQHYIYETKNNLNDKIYVGYHYGTSGDSYLGSGKMVLVAIKKYGKENFSKRILEYIDEEQWNEREVFWIANLSATDKNIGYNILPGGNKGPTLSGEQNGMYGKTHSEEAMNIIRQANFRYYETHPEARERISKQHKGKTVSDYHREVQRQRHLGTIPHNAKPCEYDNIQFTSVTKLAKYLNMSHSGLMYRIETNKLIGFRYL